MTNPLIDKYFELYPEKKEKPKPKIIDEVGSTPSQEVIERLRQLQPNSKIISASNASVSIKSKPLISYDPQSGEDSFLQIAEKVKNKDARVTSVSTSVSIERDMSMMSITTVTFEVQMWDTP